MTAVLTLAIEFSNPAREPAAPGEAGSVALGSVVAGREGVEPLAFEPVRPERAHDDALIPAIARAAEAAQVRPQDVRQVAVSVGPGGFTALRIAVTAGKMIAQAAGAACIAVPTAHAVARSACAQASSPGDRRTLDVLLGWKRDTAWRSRYLVRPGACAADEAVRPALITLADIAADAPDALVADDRLRPALEAAGLPAGARVIAPVFDARAVLACSAYEPALDPASLAPIYPREPEAVTKWRSLGRDPGPAFDQRTT